MMRIYKEMAAKSVMDMNVEIKRYQKTKWIDIIE